MKNTLPAIYGRELLSLLHKVSSEGDFWKLHSISLSFFFFSKKTWGPLWLMKTTKLCILVTGLAQ